ncbi:MAG: cyclase [Hyphomicrobiaceae bacterium]
MSMVRMFVRHDVADYAKWRAAYDDFDAERKTLGVIGHGVFRDVDNPNNVTAWHDFADAKAAKSFASLERLKSVMQAAGVQGVPQMWFAADST